MKIPKLFWKMVIFSLIAWSLCACTALKTPLPVPTATPAPTLTPTPTLAPTRPPKPAPTIETRLTAAERLAIFDQVWQTVSKFSQPQLQRAVNLIFEADKGMRSARPDDRVVMERFVLELTA